MAGIDTPAYFEPQEPQIQSWGFLSLLNLGPLIKSLSNIFGPALLGFWNAFVGFLDTVFTAFGWANGFSQLLLWISNLGSFLVNAFTTLIQWLTVLFNILVGSTTYITSVLTGIGIIITNIFSVFSMMSSILSTGFSQFTPLILPVLMLLGIFLPAIELNRMSKYGFGTLFEDLNKVMDVASFVVNGMIQVIQLFIAVIGRLIESIPLLE